MISATLEKPRTLDQEYPKPFPVKIHAPAPKPGIYHGLILDCIGMDADGLYLVPLPAVADRPSYLGRFPEHHIIRLDEAEARGEFDDF